MGCTTQSIESKVEITSLHIHKIKEKTFMQSNPYKLCYHSI